MNIYIILLIVCLGISICFARLSSDHNRKNVERIYIYIIFIIFFGIMGLRSSVVGTDTELYCRIFRIAGNSNNIMTVSEASPLYAIYNNLLYKVFGSSGQVIIFFNSFIILVLLMRFIYKNSKNIYVSVVLSLLFYFYLQAFNIARQYIAILIIVNSYEYIKNKKLLKYLIISSIAVLIHNTAIVFAIIGFVLMNLNLNIKNTFRMSVICIAGGVLYEVVLSIFIKIFPRYQLYFTTHNIFYNSGEGRKIVFTIIYIFFVCIGLYFYNRYTDREKVEKKEELMLANIMIIAIIIGMISLKSILIARIELYFSIFILIYIPMVVEKFKGMNKYIAYFIIIVMMIIPYIALLKSNNSGIIPYSFYQMNI